jgi:hypothetical protein
MPIEIRDLDNGIGVLISGTGVVTEEEFVDSHKKHLTQDEEKFKKYRYSMQKVQGFSVVNYANVNISYSYDPACILRIFKTIYMH